MARTTFVKKAQQRYATVPVLNEDGTPKRTPVMRKDGTQKTTKHGRPVFLTVTVADKTKPLPMPTCGKCGKTIEVGQPYKHISPKSGPYGGRTLYRCADCPNWNVWEYSYSLSARTAQIAHDFWGEIDNAETEDDVTGALENAAQAVRDLAEEKRESAQNIEDGFGHPTSASEDLEQVADDLENWADEIESADVPEVSDHGCSSCEGEGTEDCDQCEEGTVVAEDGTGTGSCEQCDGTGKVECSECGGSDDYVDLDAWRDEVQNNVSIVDECPV